MAKKFLVFANVYEVKEKNKQIDIFSNVTAYIMKDVGYLVPTL